MITHKTRSHYRFMPLTFILRILKHEDGFYYWHGLTKSGSKTLDSWCLSAVEDMSVERVIYQFKTLCMREKII